MCVCGQEWHNKKYDKLTVGKWRKRYWSRIPGSDSFISLQIKPIVLVRLNLFQGWRKPSVCKHSIKWKFIDCRNTFWMIMTNLCEKEQWYSKSWTYQRWWQLTVRGQQAHCYYLPLLPSIIKHPIHWCNSGGQWKLRWILLYVLLPLLPGSLANLIGNLF